MRILGIGIDVVEVDRIAAAIERHGEPFLAKLFTPAEREYCESRKHSAHALRRALRRQGGHFQSFRHRHRRDMPDCSIWKSSTIRSGAPAVRLNGAAAAFADENGITESTSASPTPATTPPPTPSPPLPDAKFDISDFKLNRSP